MNLAGVKTHFARWRAWEFNPIVVKELRQSVRSWAVTGMLLLLLSVLFVVFMVFLVNQSFEVNPGEELGGSLFSTFLVILAGAGVLFIPLHLGLRVAGERQDNDPDLLYISTLSPARIIFGKFLCGAYVALLFFSACLPFMALTNLLRGVDLPSVFFLLAMLLVVVCSVNLVAIFIACLPISKLFKILLGLAGFIALCFLLGAVMASSFVLMASGVGAMLFTHAFWMNCLTFLAVVAALGGLFFVLAVALIAPPSANRALLPRLYLTLLCLLGGVLAGAWARHVGEADVIFTWVAPNDILLVAALVVCISNHDTLSWRVRRKIPRNGLKRLPAFLFYNGAAGGLLWVAGLTTLTFLELTVFFNLEGSDSTFDTYAGWYPPMMLYLFAYALFALFLQRKFLSRRPPKLAGVLAVFITALTALGTNIVLFFMNQLSLNSADHLQLGNAFNLMGQHDAEQQAEHLWFALILLVIGLVLNGRWFLTQGRNFRPPATPPPVQE
jgi:ABC-type transport system involved in multi-copper enzyme maturation permease subunit